MSPSPREGDVLWKRELAAPAPGAQRRAGARAHCRGRDHGSVQHGREALHLQKPKGPGDLTARSSPEKEELPERQEGHLDLGRGLATGRRQGVSEVRLLRPTCARVYTVYKLRIKLHVEHTDTPTSPSMTLKDPVYSVRMNSQMAPLFGFTREVTRHRTSANTWSHLNVGPSPQHPAALRAGVEGWLFLHLAFVTYSVFIKGL